MECIFVRGVDILLFGRDDDLDLVFVPFRGLDGTQIGLNLIVAFGAPGYVVHVCELDEGLEQ